jgi:hypothetical protein
MRTKFIATALNFAASLTVFGGITRAQEDRDKLKVPDGLAFSEFKGYGTQQDIAVSETEGSVKAILENPTVIRAYKEGIPDNSTTFPDGVKIVKIEWVKMKNPVSPYLSRYQAP